MTQDRAAQLQAIAATLAPELDPACDYPALAAQAERWRTERQPSGLHILCGTPLFLNTLAQFAALLAGGADLAVVYFDELGFDPSIPDFLAGIGIPAYHGVDEAIASGIEFDVVLDCSALNRRVPVRFGYCELTRSGIHVYESEPPDKPVFAADSGRIKSIETVLGTGDGCLRGLRHIGFDPAGKTVLLFGHGRVGRGIEFALTQAGASVRIVDPAQGKPFTPSLLDGIDVVISATGILHALAPFASLLLESGALLVNMGADDEFGPDVPPDRAVNEKRPVNFMLREPTSTRYIDPTLALHSAGILELMRSSAASGILIPPVELEDSILADVRAAGVINAEIDALGL
jgi:adenosylhomocysteinase